MTTDGGATWETISDDKIGHFAIIAMRDMQVGFAVGDDGHVWRTEDRGRNWALISETKVIGNRISAPRQITFVDNEHGFLIDAFGIWKTDNGGRIWIRSLSMVDTPSFKVWQPVSITCIDSSTCSVACTNGLTHRTEDGGRSWQTRRINSDEDELGNLVFVHPRLGWMLDKTVGSIYRSDDGGKAWQQKNFKNDDLFLRSIYFLDPSEGWTAGLQSKRGESGQRAILLHTLDGGTTWTPIPVSQNERLYDRVHFTDALHGWLFAASNIYYTSDGGANWKLVLDLPDVKAEIRM
jgi:photosystem II stability/assembly factor-like uncharacterized protein